MSRKNPAHPGTIVKSELEELGISVTAAAQALGVTRQQLHRVLNGTHAISPEMAVRLERGLGSTADMWLRLQANYDLAQVAQRADQLKVRALVPA